MHMGPHRTPLGKALLLAVPSSFRGGGRPYFGVEVFGVGSVVRWLCLEEGAGLPAAVSPSVSPETPQGREDALGWHPPVRAGGAGLGDCRALRSLRGDARALC